MNNENENMFENPKPDAPLSYGQALLEAAKRQLALEELQRQLAENQLRVKWVDETMETAEATSISACAKIMMLGRMGPNNLHKYLRKAGLLMPDNRPYQRYVDMGLFSRKYKARKPDGSMRVRNITGIYPKGMFFIHQLYTCGSTDENAEQQIEKVLKLMKRDQSKVDFFDTVTDIRYAFGDDDAYDDAYDDVKPDPSSRKANACS